MPGVSETAPCQVRLFDRGKFEFACAESGHIGVGTFKLSKEVLMLRIERLWAKGRPRHALMPAFMARIEGPGNQLTLSPVDGNQSIQWRRALVSSSPTQ
jgi:hypothetical protein